VNILVLSVFIVIHVAFSNVAKKKAVEDKQSRPFLCAWRYRQSRWSSLFFFPTSKSHIWFGYSPSDM